MLLAPARGAAPRSAAAVVVAATAAPLLYYFLLSRLDDAWRLAGEANDFPIWPWWVTVIGLAPLALPALTGLRAAPDDLGGWMLRLWPLAGAGRVRAAVRDVPRPRAPGA